MLIKSLYRIYFCSNWYIYAEYISDDTCMKTMMIEVMVSQRGYRMVYYGVINFISSILFFYPSYNFNNNTLDKINGIIFFIIIFVYLVETICNYPLIVYTIKH